eukprot:5599926-Prymnesium_polylepis.1
MGKRWQGGGGRRPTLDLGAPVLRAEANAEPACDEASSASPPASAPPASAPHAAAATSDNPLLGPVSYTHLTLPTICSV